MKRLSACKASLQLAKNHIACLSARCAKKEYILGANANPSTHFLDHIVLHATFFAQTHPFPAKIEITTHDRIRHSKSSGVCQRGACRAGQVTQTMEAGSAMKRPLVRTRRSPCVRTAADSIPSFSQLIERHGLLSPRSNKTLITWTKRRAFICTSALRSGCC